MGKTIDSENQRVIRNEAEQWKEVIKHIILLIQYLGSQNLAFRRNSDQLYTRNNGNFLKLIEFVGQFDVVIAEHLRKITSKVSYVLFRKTYTK